MVVGNVSLNSGVAYSFIFTMPDISLADGTRRPDTRTNVNFGALPPNVYATGTELVAFAQALLRAAGASAHVVVGRNVQSVLELDVLGAFVNSSDAELCADREVDRWEDVFTYTTPIE